jgi:hypothetical protein
MKKSLLFFLVSFLILPFVWGFEIKDRRFEIGINAGLGFYNDFLSFNDIFSETIIIDLDNLAKGFRMDMGFGASPLFFNYNHKNEWGFGLSTGLDFISVIDLSGEMLSFGEIVDSASEMNASMFADVSIPVFFFFYKFKIKIKLFLFYLFIYMKF